MKLKTQRHFHKLFLLTAMSIQSILIFIVYLRRFKMARILIVDDSVITRSNLKKVLAKLGHEVIGEASNGSIGIFKYKQLQPDLVTMDISMPQTNGIEATTKILKFDPNALIIMVSALNQKRDIMDAIHSGAKYYILKPFKDVKVKEVIDKVLNSR